MAETDTTEPMMPSDQMRTALSTRETVHSAIDTMPAPIVRMTGNEGGQSQSPHETSHLDSQNIGETYRTLYDQRERDVAIASLYQDQQQSEPVSKPSPPVAVQPNERDIARNINNRLTGHEAEQRVNLWPDEGVDAPDVGFVPTKFGRPEQQRAPGRLISSELFYNEAGEIQYRNPETGELVPTDSKTQMVVGGQLFELVPTKAYQSAILPIRRTAEGDLTPAVPGVIEEGVMAPGRAAAGDFSVTNPYTGRTSEEAIVAASATAGLAVLGPAPAALARAAFLGADRSTLGSFLGASTLTAKKEALNLARSMERKGATQTEIWQATWDRYGQAWHRAADGAWKFEESDLSAQLKAMPPPAGQGSIPVAELLNHTKVLDAYPALKAVLADADVPEGALGVSRGGSIGLRAGMSTESTKSVTLHELGHEISRLEEGFMTGHGPNINSSQVQIVFGERDLLNNTVSIINRAETIANVENLANLAPVQVSRALGAAAREMSTEGSLGETGGWLSHIHKASDMPAEIEFIRSEAKHFTDLADKANDLLKTEMDQYHRQASEVEARNVSRRMNMTDRQRYDNPPHTTEDVPRNQQIVDNRRAALGDNPAALPEAGTPAPLPSQEVQPISPPFYSAAAKAVETSPLTKAPVSDWLGFLRNKSGVKKEELQWLGIEDWLKSQPKGSVTREEITSFVRQNEVQLKEVEKSTRNSITDNLDQWQKGRSRETRDGVETDLTTPGLPEGSGITAFHDGNGEFRSFEPFVNNHSLPATEGFSQAVRDLRERLGRTGSAPKHGEWQEPGGDNYREVLLTLPSAGAKEKAAAQAFEKVIEQRYGSVFAAQRRWTPQEKTEYERLWNAFNEATGRWPANQLPENKDFRSSHWDETNVIAHARINDRVIDGKKTLFVEEVQSDWHQKGKRGGYDTKGPLNWSEPTTILSDGTRAWKATKGDYEYRVLQRPDGKFESYAANTKAGEHVSLQEAQTAAERYISMRGGNLVPDAPFKKTWPEVVLKRMIRLASEEGYDQIAWTSGETQAARYDLSKRIEAIHWTKQKDGEYRLSFDLHNGDQHDIDAVPASKVADHVGKDIAEKIIKGEGEKTLASGVGKGTISGLDLKVGSERMASFYDKELVNIANNLGKKFGTKVEKKTYSGRTTEQIDADIEAVRTELRKQFPDLDVTGPHSWQEMWNKNPDLAKKESELLKERYNAVKSPTNTVFVMPINERLRRAAMSEGFPLFASGVPLPLDPFHNYDKNKDQSRLPQQPPAPAPVPVGAVDALKKRPDLRHHFDEKYGSGSAQRFIGNAH